MMAFECFRHMTALHYARMRAMCLRTTAEVGRSDAHQALRVSYGLTTVILPSIIRPVKVALGPKIL